MQANVMFLVAIATENAFSQAYEYTLLYKCML